MQRSYNLQPYMFYGERESYSVTENEMKRQQNLEYFQSLYPEKIKRMQAYVSKACDRMDYPNSPIYDEYPDRIMLNQMCASICEQMDLEQVASEEYEVSIADNATEVEEVEAYDANHRHRPCGVPWGPPCPRPPHPPHRPGIKDDIVRILLLNELFNRRCRNGRC